MGWQKHEAKRDCPAAGEDALGITQKERQLHSITSAARETGIGAGLLEQFLVYAGAISADDERPAARKTFDAKANIELLAEIPTLVGSLEMQNRIGATQRQLASLVGVTSREVVRVFLKHLWFEFVPVFHGPQGRFAL